MGQGWPLTGPLTRQDSLALIPQRTEILTPHHERRGRGGTAVTRGLTAAKPNSPIRTPDMETFCLRTSVGRWIPTSWQQTGFLLLVGLDWDSPPPCTRSCPGHNVHVLKWSPQPLFHAHTWLRSPPTGANWIHPARLLPTPRWTSVTLRRQILVRRAVDKPRLPWRSHPN